MTCQTEASLHAEIAELKRSLEHLKQARQDALEGGDILTVWNEQLKASLRFWREEAMRISENLARTGELYSKSKCDLAAAQEEIRRLNFAYDCAKKMQPCPDALLKEQLAAARGLLVGIRNEIDCRIQHGANSNGHLEGVLAIINRDLDAAKEGKP